MGLGTFADADRAGMGADDGVLRAAGAERRAADRGSVSWQEAEDALLGAVEYLAALPDRERGYLSAGSRSAWPTVLRIEQSDYPDEPDRRIRLGRKEMAHLERMLTGERACALAVPEQHRALVGRVLAMKLSERGGGFSWSEVWEREGGRRCGVTSDALRMRYERAVAKVARRMEIG